MARPERFELPTTWFEARYSIQLSYGRVACNCSRYKGKKGPLAAFGTIDLYGLPDPAVKSETPGLLVIVPARLQSTYPHLPGVVAEW